MNKTKIAWTDYTLNTIMQIGQKIRFEEENKDYEIMARDTRFLICQRPYTVKEGKDEIKAWDDGLEEYMRSEYELTDKKESYEDFYEDNYDELYPHYKDENGEQPEGVSKDTFAYTIVDLKENIRGADNYYCKFDYSKREECEEALKELNTLTIDSEKSECREYKLQISRRNRVELNIQIKTEGESDE